MTHGRRRAKNVPLVINIAWNMKFVGNKDVVLSSDANKERLIRLIGGKLVENGCIVKYSEADADIAIVLTAIKESENQNVVLIGEDTDLLILLLYHAPSSNPYKLIFRSDKRDALYSSEIFDIYDLKNLLSDETCSWLVFIHAFMGCDTTSAFYGISSSISLKNQKVFLRYLFSQIPQNKILQIAGLLFEDY